MSSAVSLRAHIVGRAVAGTAILAAILAAAGPLAASGGGGGELTSLDVRFGVYFDREGTVCSGTIRPGSPGTVYIVAHSAPGTEIISGAEFRFTGLPPSWTVFSVPNPLCLNLGDPFANGVNIAATNPDGNHCGPQWATFLMYTVLVIATEEVDDVRFELTNREPPTNPAFRCPLVTDCTSTFTSHCVQTTPCFVNRAVPAPCDGVTAVEPRTWTGVREMYR